MQSVVADLVAQRPGPDVVVMAAAVADFRPKHYAATKIKKTHEPGDVPDESAPVIELVRNPDILAGLVHARAGSAAPVIVGFAAETGDASGSVLQLARAKLARKGCDLLVANEVGVDKTFGQDVNTVHLLYRDGRPGAHRRARGQGCRGRRGVGRGRALVDPAVESSSACFRLLPAASRARRPAIGEHVVRTPLHVRVSHRRSPGQDLRPDQRRHPRRDARPGPRVPGSPSRRW
jgi:hypothetical protein